MRYLSKFSTGSSNKGKLVPPLLAEVEESLRGKIHSSSSDTEQLQILLALPKWKFVLVIFFYVHGCFELVKAVSENSFFPEKSILN